MESRREVPGGSAFEITGNFFALPGFQVAFGANIDV